MSSAYVVTTVVNLGPLCGEVTNVQIWKAEKADNTTEAEEEEEEIGSSDESSASDTDSNDSPSSWSHLWSSGTIKLSYRELACGILALLLIVWSVLVTCRLQRKAAMHAHEAAIAAGSIPDTAHIPRWPIAVGVFYALAIFAQSPAVWLALIPKDVSSEPALVAIALTPLLLIIVGGAMLLLGLRIPAGPRRMMPKRHIALPIAATIVLFLVLSFALTLSLSTAIGGDKYLGWFTFVLIFLLWAAWGAVFYFYTRRTDRDTMFRRIVRLMIAGSVLEMLVGVTSHVAMRYKDVCCAPAANFWGMTMGLSIMLLAFGPGVVFLYLNRMMKKKRRAAEQNVQ